MEKKTIYEKLAVARQWALEQQIRKSGINLHAEFTYFELKDIVPWATKAFADLECVYITTFEDGVGYGRLYDYKDPTQMIQVSAPMVFMSEPGKFRMNEVQGMGATITYMRRYLYFLILDLVEADEIDEKSSAPIVAEPARKPNKPATTEERTEIKEELTAVDDRATDLQITALKNALKALLDADTNNEDFVQQLAVQTEGFTNLTKANCETLINGINEMLEA